MNECTRLSRRQKLLLPALAAAVCGLFLSACASSYADGNGRWTGGFFTEKVGQDRWIVEYSANGYTTYETAQTYWLYRCAELALEQGYDGFEIVGSLQLSAPQEQSLVMQVIYQDPSKPNLVEVVRLLRAPVEYVPGRVFDARVLKDFLRPHVEGEKCGSNVCPHVHEYLFRGFGKTKADTAPV